MKLVKCIVVFGLCLLVGSCPEPGITINIGDYEYHLEMWNNQNILDYQLSVTFRFSNEREQAVVFVKNGIPESSDPPTWLANGKKSTVSDFFSFIKEEERRLMGNGRGIWDQAGFFIVNYDIKYHYPIIIKFASRTTGSDQSADWHWTITLTPIEETEQ